MEYRVCAAHHELEVFACGEAQTELRLMSGIGRWLRDIQSLYVTLFLYHVDRWCQAIDWQLVSVPQLIVALCQCTCREGAIGTVSMSVLLFTVHHQSHIQTALSSPICYRYARNQSG